MGNGIVVREAGDPSPSSLRCPVCGRIEPQETCPACGPFKRVPPPAFGHPHRLVYGDTFESYYTCVRCGANFARSVKVVDLIAVPCQHEPYPEIDRVK